MIILGLTGSMATGKSTVAKAFKKLWHIPVWDADEQVRILLKSPSIQEKLKEFFPFCFIEEKLERSLLKKHVFENPQELRVLESLLYPSLMTHVKAFISHHQRQHANLIVLDVPLLLEKGWSHLCDYIMVVTCRPDIQRQRILHRQGMTEKQMDQVLLNQIPQQIKLKLADFGVHTDLSKGHTVLQLKNILKNLNIIRTGHA